MVELIEIRIKDENKKKFFPLILADYYEIMKELITSLLLCDGFKSTGHRELVEYLKKNYLKFSVQDMLIVDKLRVLRNKSVYEGFKIPIDYLVNNEIYFKKIINKLKLLVKDKLKSVTK